MIAHYVARTEGDLQHLVNEGLLEESHHVELKRELPSGKGSNKEFGRDLASLAVDGGVLYIGIDEGPIGQVPTLHPIELAGLPERIDQVARSVVRPALDLGVTAIPSHENPRQGYVAVTVPPSGDAPHMVDGTYWGRGAKTKERLSDFQVREVLHGRARAREIGASALIRLVDRDPTPPGLRDQGHLFVLARPLFGASDLLLRTFGGDSASKWLTDHILRGMPMAQASKWSPDLGNTAATVSRRARGWAIHSYEMGVSRELRGVRVGSGPVESGLLDVEFDEDGTVQLFCGRATDERNGARLVLDGLVIGLTRRVVVCASVIAEAAAYRGPWLLGLAVTNLRGALSWHLVQDFAGSALPYSETDYLETIEVPYDALVSDVDTLVHRLYGRLDRALTGGRLS